MKNKYLVSFTFLFLLGGCSPLSLFSSGVASLDTTSQERGIGGYVTDQEIKTRVNMILFEYDHVLHHKVDVNVYEGRVLLTGSLKNKKMQEDAMRLTWQVPGVKTVINETEIESRRSLGQYTKDKWISAKMHALLFLNGDVGSRNYEIVVSRGIVYLTGIAKDKEELESVIHTARTTRYVKKVISYVRLMNLYEVRRRKIFNERKNPSPLEEERIQRRKIIQSEKQRTNWETSDEEMGSTAKKKQR